MAAQQSDENTRGTLDPASTPTSTTQDRLFNWLKAIGEWASNNPVIVGCSLVVAALLGTLGFELWDAMPAIDDKVTAEDYSKTLRNYGLLLVGAIGLPLAIWRSWIAQRQVKTAEHGQVTERFTRAIDQLGAKDGEEHNLPVRLGAIYALEHIANDAPDYVDTVAQVLSQYCLMNVDAPTTTDWQATDANETEASPELRVLRTDITAILDVIARWRHRALFDLRGINLARIDIRNGNFEKAMLAGADFCDAILSYSSFKYVNLVGAQFSGADLVGVSMQGAKMTSADVSGAVLVSANLTKANLNRARLCDTSLVSAKLCHADLRAAKIIAADLTGADLSHAKLKVANLSDANLTRANLTDADLTRANLTDTFVKELGGDKQPFTWEPIEPDAA